MENHGGMMSTEENSSFIHQSSLAVLPEKLSGSKQEERVKGNNEFGPSNILFTLASDLTHAVKFYDMGPTALLSPPKKTCCGFLLSLKINCFSRL
jgi:hypothetical protein